MSGGWASLGLLPELVQTIEDEFRWGLPTGIQDEAIPLILGGSDVMASAETGSGKTAAFALPILQLCTEIKEKKESKQSPSSKGRPATKEGESSTITLNMSPNDRDSCVAIDPSCANRIQSRDVSRWSGCRATMGVPLSQPGQYSFTCTVLDEGLVRVGWSKADATLQLGTDSGGYGYGGTGVKVNNGDYDPYPNEQRLAFGKDDTIGCHLEIQPTQQKTPNSATVATISYSKNGVDLGVAFEIQKKSIKAGDILFPTACLKNAQCSFDFSTTGASTKDDSKSLSERMVALTRNPKDAHSGETGKGPLAVIIEPTRDLAEQTYRAFVDLAVNLPEDLTVQSALLVGGISPKETNSLLQKDRVDVLVGTPPIIASYMRKGSVSCGKCRFFVLDEADELIANDSLQDIRSIYSRMVAANATNKSRFERLQVCFFSATLHSKEVRQLSDEICLQPLWVDLRGKDNSILPETVHHCFIDIRPQSFDAASKFLTTDGVHRKGKIEASVSLDNLSEKEGASEKIKQLKLRAVRDLIDKFAMDQVLIFCRTNLDCDLMEKYLRSLTGGGLADGYTCRVLAGMRSMEERKQSLKDFKEGEVKCLIATDVAARGIDIRELPFVINVTLPDMKQSPQTYVHRAGRVGRADRMGLCLSLVATVEERVWYCRKGTKPPCSDTSDYSRGGNCIWYNEPQFRVQVEELLKTNKTSSVAMSYPDLVVPPEMQRILENGGYGDVVEEVQETPPQLTEIRDQIQQVIASESALQDDFWALRNQFRKQTTII